MYIGVYECTFVIVYLHKSVHVYLYVYTLELYTYKHKYMYIQTCLYIQHGTKMYMYMDIICCCFILFYFFLWSDFVVFDGLYIYT